jgi:hypothetical protein
VEPNRGQAGQLDAGRCGKCGSPRLRRGRSKCQTAHLSPTREGVGRCAVPEVPQSESEALDALLAIAVEVIRADIERRRSLEQEAGTGPLGLTRAAELGGAA